MQQCHKSHYGSILKYLCKWKQLTQTKPNPPYSGSSTQLTQLNVILCNTLEAQDNSMQPNITQCNWTQLNTTQRNSMHSMQLNLIQRISTQHNTTQHKHNITHFNLVWQSSLVPGESIGWSHGWLSCLEWARKRKMSRQVQHPKPWSRKKLLKMHDQTPV